MGKLFAFVVAAGLLIGFLLPSGQPKAVEAAIAAPGMAHKVVLTRGSTGHFFTDAKVNGKPGVKFIVDTGASMVALTLEDAETVGIKVEPNKFEIIGEGASGPVRGQSIMIDSIEVDGIVARNVRGVILADSRLSLLGQSFLANVDQVSMSGEYLSLNDAG
jgi:aspartyl protease family protein